MQCRVESTHGTGSGERWCVSEGEEVMGRELWWCVKGVSGK